MAPRSIVARLDDILSSIDLVHHAISRRSYDDFISDRVLHLAVERAIEIISEASKHIPEADKENYPEIPWRSIKTIGNIIRHAYDKVDSTVIWNIANVDLATLEPAISTMRSNLLKRGQARQVSTRIDQRFKALKSEGRAALVAFVTAGDPDLETSKKILAGLPGAGADIIELGMPFSDPMADGPAIQASSQRALKGGQTIKKTLAMVRDFRKQDTQTPIVLMGYYNPIYVYPAERFVDDAARAGVDGLIIVDIPPEADDELCLPAVARGLNFIRLATPTTDSKRLPAVLANTSGFVYYVSITGITGTAKPDPKAVHAHIARIKKATDLPVAAGFGVKTPAQAKAMAKGADGVVVGSVLVTAIAQSLGSKGRATSKTVAAVLDLVKGLAKALRSA